MTCRELTEFLDAYLAGELSPAEAAEFERHLAVCDACVRYLDSYEKTVELTGAAFAADAKVDEVVPEELLRAILAARRRES
jgi:anti-sigma factor RsiW